MRHTAVLLAAVVASVATVAVVATSGSAQSPGPISLHLVDKSQKSVGFFPHRKPRQGDRFGFGNAVSGDDTGTDRAVCTAIGTNEALCTVQVRLSKGNLSAQGMVKLSGRAKNNPFLVTGGTGAYDGARGTALVSDVNSSTSNIDVTLLP